MPVIDVTSVSQAVKLLKDGEVVVYPTETAYALGADALNKKAVQKVYRLKARDGKKPLAVLVNDISLIKKYFKVSKVALRFAQKFWPGPLTMIFPVKDKRLHLLSQQSFKVGVRITANQFAKQAAKRLARPIIATSANVTGKGTPYSRRAVYRQFNRQNEVVYFLDKGTLPRRATSAMVEVNNDSIKVYRSNPILKNA